MENWIRVTCENAGELRVGYRLKELGDFGGVVHAVVTSLPQLSNGQWTWTATDFAGHNINYLITCGFEHYGPNVYVAAESQDEFDQIDTDVSVDKGEVIEA